MFSSFMELNLATLVTFSVSNLQILLQLPLLPLSFLKFALKNGA